MRTAMPDVLLLTALLSPRDEEHLMAHLKTLEHAGHLQTHTIPQLASALQPGEKRGARGLLAAFRRKKGPEAAAAGCDPDLFGDEIRLFLQRAADKKREMQNPDHAAPDMRPRPAGAAAAAAHAESASAPPSSWSSPFEWKPSNPSSPIAYPESPIAHPGSPIAHPGSPIAHPESPIAHPGSPIAHPESPIAHPESLIATSESLNATSESLNATPESAVPDLESLIATPEPLVAPRESLIATPGSAVADPEPEPESDLEPELEPVAAGPESLMAHLRPPAGITTAASIAQRAQAALTYDALEAPEWTPEPVEAAEPAQDFQIHEPTTEESPIHDLSMQLSSIQDLPIQDLPIQDLPIQDSRIQDSRLGIRDQRSGIRDKRLGAWARAEHSGRDASRDADDLRALLNGLAVPAAVVAVGYGRGCRIRRVRVPAPREPHDTEAAGAVIVSKRVLAEQRDRPGA
jgi:hypothetical protein